MYMQLIIPVILFFSLCLLYVCAPVWVCVHMSSYMCRPEVNSEYPPLLFFILLFDTGSIAETIAYQLARLAGQ